MENYRIIEDRDILQDFVDNFLPELGRSETFYVSLFARKKYCTSVNSVRSDKAQLKRFTSSKEFLVEKLEKLEVRLGTYYQRYEPVPQEALAVYISPNPRCFEKARSRICFVDFDFDGRSAVEVRDLISVLLNEGAYEILKTRGGCHVLVRPERVEAQYVRSWHSCIKSLQGCDIVGDCMIPVPGCHQGGFVPEFLVIK